MPPAIHADAVDELVRDELDRELAGLDALEQSGERISLGRRVWSSAWPKLTAIGVVILFWQVLVWVHWREPWQLPPPLDVWRELRAEIGNGDLIDAMRLTMRRALSGYALALVIGAVVGLVVSRFRIARAAFGSFITGIQTMPSVAWVPLAILLFKKSEATVAFIVVLGAAPSIANGVINGADQVPPLLVRSGKVLGARGLGLYRTVLLPAALPYILGGLKQGWAFAWRSLMAAELIVLVRGTQSIGVTLQNERDINNAAGLVAAMVVILVIGIVVDGVFFGGLERWVHRRWGLIDSARA